MKDSNFLKENNDRLMWHPMTSPQDSADNPPKIITDASGVSITDIDGHTVVDGVGGLWNVNLGYSCQPVKDAMAAQLDKLPYYSTFRGTSNDVAIVQEVAYQNGATVRVSGPNLILSPPLALSEADANTLLAALDAGFAAA